MIRLGKKAKFDIDFYLYTYDLVEMLNPEDPNELSDIIENLLYTVQEVMHDYAVYYGMEQPEEFL